MADILTRTEQQALYRAAEIVMEYAVSAREATWEAFFAADVRHTDYSNHACIAVFGFSLHQYVGDGVWTREQARDLLIGLAVMGGPDD